MPIVSRIVPELDLLYVLVVGESTMESLIEYRSSKMNIALLDHPNLSILVDFTKGDVEIGLPAIKALMKSNKQEYEAKGDLLKTVVVSNSSFSMIMAETIRLIGDGLPLKLDVFTTVPDALKGLGLEDHLERIITMREEMLLGGDTTDL